MRDDIGDTDGLADNASVARTRIRQMIRKGEVAPDGKLPTERELCAQFGISRRSVRRALDALEAEGLVWRKQGRGTFAGLAPDPNGPLAAKVAADADPLSVMEARLALEPELAALAARRATAEDVARMRALAERANHARYADAAELWDGSLHRMIARVAGNPILVTAFTIVNEVRQQLRWQQERQQARSPELVAEYDLQHIRIIEAIDARDEAGARSAMRAHLSALRRNLERMRGQAEAE